MEIRVTTLSEKMAGDIAEESTRLGCWGVLSEGTGAQLLNGSAPMTKQDLFSKLFIVNIVVKVKLTHTLLTLYGIQN